ncbi:MAG: FAD-dependent oxidoreductase [Candidatus Cloacimonetes bacterium]|nr:FAD-dependent oxidoreductase [Candidatus Cloacimonadota bacterium]
MSVNRILKHPVLPVPERDSITFYWNGEPLKAKRGEVISSALIANNVRIFGTHPKDGSAQGIFCANGQCAKCTVIANGVPVKSCMIPVLENMIVERVDGLPYLPETDENPQLQAIKESSVDVLIVGGGPAGLSSALEIAGKGLNVLIADDKQELGGKLVLQTHKFFGSVEDSYAGTRGNEIGRMLAARVLSNEKVDVWLNSTVLHVFKDKKVGILKDSVYHLIVPRVVLNTAGAREKFLRFPGNTLAGVYGAGAFQTLVNRDLVRSSKRLFIIGGGNVGLIAGYHALQAGIDVVGLAEVMPDCGGYRVHADKLKRFGVPIYTSHSILSAQGDDEVTSVTIAQVDEHFQPIQGTEKSFACDTVLIAVGLSPVNEFTIQAEKAGIDIFSAGDANEIAEASSAMFNGKIAGLKVAGHLGATASDIPVAWYEKAEVLKSPPGTVFDYNTSGEDTGIFPVLHCLEEMPCNPCTFICPTSSIKMDNHPILGVPKYTDKGIGCIGCMKCVAICPGLAITVVDYRKSVDTPLVTLPYEVSNIAIQVGDMVEAMDIDGNELGKQVVVSVRHNKEFNTDLVTLKSTRATAKKIAGIRVQVASVSKQLSKTIIPKQTPDDAMICLCERVTVGEVRKLIKSGITDLNQLKAISRCGMGSCGSKTCDVLVKQVFREEGISLEEITDNVNRPVFVEVPLGKFANGEKEGVRE